MMKNKHLFKHKNILGMTLIETIVSMWILGIVIVSMLSFVGATMSKRNQNKIQAIAVAKSELQDSEMEIRVEDKTINKHATIILFKSSYLIDSENNESKIESEDTFFTKHIIDAPSNEYQLSNASSSKGEMKSISNGNNPSEAINNKSGDSKEIEDLITARGDTIQKIDSDTNGLEDVLDKFISNPVSNRPTPGGGGVKGPTVPPNFSYGDIEELFKTSIDENIRYEKYKKIEEAYINYENKKLNGLNPGFKCFILLTECDEEPISKDGFDSGRQIKIKVRTLYAAEKKNDGRYPLNIYDISSDLKLGTGIVN